MHSSDELIRVYGVLSHAIDEVWLEAIPYVHDALNFSDGKYTVDAIYANLKNQTMQLWVAYKNTGLSAILVTQISNYPTGSRLCLFLFGGDGLDEYMEFFNQIIEGAKEKFNCKTLEIYGRPAWEKKLKHIGFKKIQTIFTADIGD
jgi:uncharacterized protein (DUF2126 family)